MTLLPKVKLKSAVNFPAAVDGGAGIGVSKINGHYTINLAYQDFAPPVGVLPDAANLTALLWNAAHDQYVLSPISLLGGGGLGIGLGNPVTQIGLSPVNGISTTTALRADGAPALSQAIAPIWTGQHTFNGGMKLPFSAGFVQTNATGTVISAKGVVNITAYGGVGDGVTGNDAAFDAAWAVVNAAGGGCIYFPAGVYRFVSKINKTLSTANAALSLMGDGIGSTRLHWPNANGGIAITGPGTMNNCQIDFRGFKLTTAQADGGTGIFLSFGGNVNSPVSVIQDVVIQGDDYAQGAGSHYWGTDIYLNAWQNITLDRVMGNGHWANPLSGCHGTALVIGGDVASQTYTQSVKATNCNFGYHQNTVVLQSYWQGILFDQTNFGGATCILVPGSQTGVLVQLGITNCIFYAESYCCYFATNVQQFQIMNSNAGVAGAGGGTVLNLGNSSNPIVVGNALGVFTSTGGVAGVATSGPGALILGNLFYMNTASTGVALQAGSAGATVALNQYTGLSGPGNQVTNSGTGNNVGVITK